MPRQNVQYSSMRMKSSSGTYYYHNIFLMESLTHE